MFYHPQDTFRLYPEFDLTSPSLEPTFAVDTGEGETDPDVGFVVDDERFPLFNSASVSHTAKYSPSQW